MHEVGQYWTLRCIDSYGGRFFAASFAILFNAGVIRRSTSSNTAYATKRIVPHLTALKTDVSVVDVPSEVYHLEPYVLYSSMFTLSLGLTMPMRSSNARISCVKFFPAGYSTTTIGLSY